MPFCDQCGAENPDWARFCDQCGKALIPVAPQAAPAGGAGPAPVAGASSQCPQCGTAVIPGEAFCDNCGAPLFPAAAGPQAAAAPPVGGIPPAAGVSRTATNGLATHGCTSTRASGDHTACGPRARRAARAHDADGGQLQIPSRNASLPLPASDQVLIGRTDAVSGVYPDIDLTPYGGIESGVGRRHVRLLVQQGQVWMEDLNSVNGTFLNGQRLPANSPQTVKGGDEVRLGTLVLKLQI